MNFAQAPHDPKQNLVGISAVVLLHVVVVYALVSGLAKKVVEVVRAPIETKVIEEIKDEPPPPEVEPPPPQLEAPPPPYIPPPDITVAAPPPEPTIVATVPTPPPAPVPFTPAPPPVEAAPAPVAPPAPPAPAVVSLGVACPTRVAPVLPPKLEGTAGSVKARITIKGGKVTAVNILSSTPKGAFDGVVRAAVMQYGCVDAGGGEQVADQTFTFLAE